MKAVATASAAIVLVTGLCGCSGGGTAATVNGTEISESRVTSYIESVRSAYGLTDDSTWALYLETMSLTPEEIREQAIEVLVEELLVSEAATEAGYSVSDDEVDEMIEQIKSQYSSDSEWEEALSNQGTTEEQLKEDYRSYCFQQIVRDEIISVPEPSDEEIQAAIDENISTYDGAKRSSHILFDLEDEETAQSVLEELINGADFAEMAQEYSIDSSAESGGDVGWDCEATFVDAYQTALDSLSAGEMMQELVQSDYGYHIILCTEEFYVTDETMTADDIPESIYEAIYDDLIDSLTDSAYQAYVDDLVANADIQINDMPSGLSYDVEVSIDDSSTDSSDETTDDEDTSSDTSEDSDSTDDESTE